MSEPQLAMVADAGTDDLPRTLRREREAREREARERETRGREFAMTGQTRPSAAHHHTEMAPPYQDDLQPAAVRRLDVPFLHLVLFFIKAVFAAVPALIILGVILWFAGDMLQTYFPQLIKMQILIRFPH